MELPENRLKEEIYIAPSKKVAILLNNAHMWFVQFDYIKKDKRLWVSRNTTVVSEINGSKIISTTQPIRWLVDNDDDNAFSEIIETILNQYSPIQTIKDIIGI